MARQWIIGALLLGCILLGEACQSPNKCVDKDLCLEEAPAFTYRAAGGCAAPQVCCEEAKGGNGSNNKDGVQDVKFEEETEGSEKEGSEQKGSDQKGSELEGDDNMCGLSNRNGLDATVQVSVDQARSGEFPWAIALFSNGKYLAGGSLVAPGVVLTAAHLLRRKTEANIVVRAGEWDLSTTTEKFAHEERKVERIVRHKGFNYLNGANNVALLFLDTPFQLKAHIRTICLPRQVKSFEGKRCKVVGWGRRSFPDSTHSNILKKIELPMVDSATCQRQLRNTVLGGSFNLAPSLICAGGELDQDACLGDGGSALFCALEEDPDRYEQVGIVSWGVECGKQDVPATYTNVGMFREWIDQHMAENNAPPLDIKTEGPPIGFTYRKHKRF